nr:uncharacterized protein LOC119186398 [Rhipicephalus microplus]
MEGRTTCYRDVLQRPARPSSLSVGSGVYVIPKRCARGPERYRQYVSSPVCDATPAPSPPVRGDSLNGPLVVPPPAEQICPQPRTPHKDQYERLYGTFEMRQKRELFQQSRYSSNSLHAESSYLAQHVPRKWREQNSTRHDHNPECKTERTYARQELPSRSASFSSSECPGEANGKVTTVKNSHPQQSHGPAASFDGEKTWPGRPIRKSGTENYQRPSPRVSENGCTDTQSPASQADPVPLILLQIMPKFREELASFDESWVSFQGAWRALLRDRCLANDRTSPTLLQVLGKMAEQVMNPDYSDHQVDLPGKTLHSLTPGQREDQSNDRDETHKSVMSLPSIIASERKSVCSNTDSYSSCGPCDFNSSLAPKPSLDNHVDGMLRKLESSVVDLPNQAAETQETRVKPSDREDVECTESWPNMSQANYSRLSPGLMHEQSMTMKHNQESSELKERRTSFSDSSEEDSAIDVMEWPSSHRVTPVDITHESCEEELSSCSSMLTSEYCLWGKPSASVYPEKSASEAITATTCFPAFERLPWWPLQQKDKVVQQKPLSKEAVCSYITRTSLAPQPFDNGITPSSVSPDSPTNWKPAQKKLCPPQLKLNERLDSMATTFKGPKNFNNVESQETRVHCTRHDG